VNADKTESAMVLAAGLGTRMREQTHTKPKPLVEVGGKSLIDRVLDRVVEAGVTRAVVNVHHFADLLLAHLASRGRPRIEISDERGQLLNTGGGVVRALPLLGNNPFLLANSDSIWIEGATPNLVRLVAAYRADEMDAMLLLAPVAGAIGYAGAGDYSMNSEGRLTHRAEREIAPFVYAGAAILHPRLFENAPSDAFSLTQSFAKAEESDRLFGLRLDGMWMHVGTPEAILAAEDAIRRSSE
jgi:N-acetyl-alpha-D-muramate 1-phosphate uridylyltransferase